MLLHSLSPLDGDIWPRSDEIVQRSQYCVQAQARNVVLLAVNELASVEVSGRYPIIKRAVDSPF